MEHKTFGVKAFTSYLLMTASVGAMSAAMPQPSWVNERPAEIGNFSPAERIRQVQAYREALIQGMTSRQRIAWQRDGSPHSIEALLKARGLHKSHDGDIAGMFVDEAAGVDETVWHKLSNPSEAT